MIDCRPGQRWISTTEPELGLGMVVEIEHRRVTMSFPAGDERRTYALDNAPLTRVTYRVADRVRTEDGRELIVAELADADGCVVYHGIDARGTRHSVHEIDLDSFVQFSRPLDRLFSGQADKASRFRLRAETLRHRHRQMASAVFGLVGPRVQLLPHQFYIAEEVSNRHAPRVLLADEVGLGKTIEAGLVLHRHLLTGRAARVLVLTPPNLVNQWLVEMLRRFNLRFSILDPEQCEELEASGEHNPFEAAQLVLASLELLAGDTRRLDQAVHAGWDLVVVDEAHHLDWSPAAASPAYAAIERLAARVPGLLLLTATPEQLGVAGHFARLRLLDPARYDDLDAFLAEEARYAEVSALVERLAAGDDAPDGALQRELEDYLGAARMAALAATADDGATPAERIIAELLDHHGTGRVLFRNCRDNIEGFPVRRLRAYPLVAPAAVNGLVGEAALTPETALGADWLTQDPRVGWLAGFLGAHRTEKTLVICARADTAQTLEAHLRARHGLRSAAFHEGMDLVQRDRAAAYFADREDDAQALVCSEIGSEGRNFQFARHLVLFDLPPHPDLLEQRIGRLDRIGQAYEVAIHAPYLEGTAQHVWLRWLHEGIDAFERICPAAAALFDANRERLAASMRAPEDTAALESLIEQTRAQSAELTERLRAGRDRLLERNSFDPTVATTVLRAVREAEHVPELADWLGRVFDEFGVEHEDNGEASLVLQPGDHMLCHEFPGLPEGGLTVTFERGRALARDDMQFVTWEHPLAAGAADLVLGGEFGNASFGVLRAPGFEAGTLVLEALFVVVCPAPRALQVERYLPRSALRVVVDAAGRELGDTLDAERLAGMVRDVPPATAAKVLAKMRTPIEALADHAAHLAEARADALTQDAVNTMGRSLDFEIERLRQLAAVNPNVRQDEIRWLEETRAKLGGYLRGAGLRLDAVRVAVAT